ncbi:MAG: ABC transporter permease [Actinobacteria bacterium]|nr:ABC transporter permease [Actinomycetota bacterium]
METRWKFFVLEALKSLRGNFATTVAAVVTVLVVMFIAGIGIALGSYVYNYSNKVRDDVTIRAYLKDSATDKQIAEIQRTITETPGVQPDSLQFISKDDAILRLQEQLGKDSELLQLTLGNPLPASFEFKAVDPDQTATVAKAVAGLPGLDPPRAGLPNPDYGAGKADRVLKTAGTITLVLLGMGVVLAIAAVLLIGNTIRLSIFARRREVEVQKLVGATNWFVRLPFMIEGMICGVAGAIGAAVLLAVSYQTLLADRVESAMSGSGSPNAIAFPLLVVLLILAGLGIGALGSGLTMRRFLQV